MQQVISTQEIHLTAPYFHTIRRSVTKGLINRFITWCDLEERNRFMWLGIAFMCGIGTVLPVTLSTIVFIGGNNLALWIIACTINVPILVVNLAAQTTKITLPTFF